MFVLLIILVIGAGIFFPAVGIDEEEYNNRKRNLIEIDLSLTQNRQLLPKKWLSC